MKINYDKAQEEMRRKIKIIKAQNSKTSREISEELQINYNSFCRWLCG